MNYIEDFKKSFLCSPPTYLPPPLKDRLDFLSCLREKPHRSVYLVADKETCKKSILKITEKQSSDSAKSEYAILSGLNHEGIPKALHYEEDQQGREYLLRSFMEGDPLSLLLERDALFSQEQVFNIILKVCNILNYLHRQTPPIIYRDISPGNITLTPNGKVSLIDFGISKKMMESSHSPDTRMIGTLPFVSPEQMGYDITDHRTDIFSLGKLMLYLSTGHTETSLPFFSNNPTSLEKIIIKCTRQSKEKRFSSIKQLEKAIKRAQNQPTRQAYQKSLVGILFLVFLIVGFSFILPSKNTTPSHPLFKIDFGEVDENLPVKNPVLIQAAREVLEIPLEVPLTTAMLENVTTLTLALAPHAQNLQANQQNLILSSDVLEELSFFQNLSSLTIKGYSLLDITPLSTLPLKALTLNDSQITNISPLSKMFTLTSLNLSHNPIDNILPLSPLAQLEEVNISFTPVRDISPLEKLNQLTSLNLCATQTTDFSPLASLEQLEKLIISHVQIKDFSFLTGLINLIHLELRSTGFYDLAYINSPLLTVLDVSLNYNYLTNISRLSDFPQLEVLDVSLDYIQDYTPLHTLSNLQILGIHENEETKDLFNLGRL